MVWLARPQERILYRTHLLAYPLAADLFVHRIVDLAAELIRRSSIVATPPTGALVDRLPTNMRLLRFPWYGMPGQAQLCPTITRQWRSDWKRLDAKSRHRWVVDLG